MSSLGSRIKHRRKELGLTQAEVGRHVGVTHVTISQWENEISTDMTWTVRDGTGFIWYSGTDIVLANNCLSMQLTWSMIKAYQDSH